MATLDDLLALLPDNATGQIDAADLRTIVTELHRLASTIGQVFAFQWTTSATPASGRVGVDDWTNATELRVSETAADGAVLGFSLVDGSIQDEVWLRASSSVWMKVTLAGPSVDMGTYRTIPITVEQVSGPAPANNANVSVSFVGVV